MPPAPRAKRRRGRCVEDDVHLQTMYELTLASLPFPVDFKMAGDGFTGLVRIGEFRPHVIIADLNLPGLDGFRMIRALKDAPESRSSELVVISALTREDIEDRGGLPSDVAVLSKPVPMSTLERFMVDSRAYRPCLYSR
jgi:CheY-like chemotaxis protein